MAITPQSKKPSSVEYLRTRLSQGGVEDYPARVALSIANRLKNESEAGNDNPGRHFSNLRKSEQIAVIGEWADMVSAAHSKLLAFNTTATKIVSGRIWRTLLSRIPLVKKTKDIDEIFVCQLAADVLSAEAVRECQCAKYDLNKFSMPKLDTQEAD